MTTKTVLLPIKVPKGDYCFSSQGTCGKFDNMDAGYPLCEMGIADLEVSPDGQVIKPDECKELNNENR